MASGEFWSGVVVLALLLIWAIVERRMTRQAIESRGGDGTDRAMLGKRVVYLREPAAGAQGASPAPAPSVEPELPTFPATPGDLPPPVHLAPPELRSDSPAGAPEPASAHAPEQRRAGPPTSAPDPSRAATTPPPLPSQQPPASGAHVAVTPAVFGPVLPGLVAAGLGKRPSGTHSAAPVPRSDRRPPPPPPRPARTHTLVGLSEVASPPLLAPASPPPLAPASRSPGAAPAPRSRPAPIARYAPPPAPVPSPPQLAPPVEPAPSLPRVASAEDFDDATVVGERLTAEQLAQLGLPVLDVDGRVVGRVQTKTLPSMTALAPPSLLPVTSVEVIAPHLLAAGAVASVDDDGATLHRGGDGSAQR
jgi:hypothetical protein